MTHALAAAARIATVCLGLLLGVPATATEPPAGGGPLPAALREKLAANPKAFTFERSLRSITERAFLARTIVTHVPEALSVDRTLASRLAELLGPAGVTPHTKVQGVRRIPVLLVDFSDSSPPSYTEAVLQRELFDGPWPTGTMTEYYKEISLGALTVNGTVFPWVSLQQSAEFYQGGDFETNEGSDAYCYGLCKNAHLADFLRDALDKNATIAWNTYDNDGPDGVANSGDDDGAVDFVAFVHAGIGGECQGEGNRNVWSHRGSFRETLGAPAYITTSSRKSGGKIEVNDYVVVPALACDGKTMIQIGVFAHEFGHAFGLPDLYDTEGYTAGLGYWDLMAYGGSGGDGSHPERPTHMSPWSKDFLGWIDVQQVTASTGPTKIRFVEASHRALRVNLSGDAYYLVNAIGRTGFNADLPASGLQVWQVTETIVNSGLASNRVNADVLHPGVKLIQADGSDGLTTRQFRGGPGDVFPGQAAHHAFDATTRPASIGGVSICAIALGGGDVSATFSPSRCTLAPGPAAPSGFPPVAAAPPAAAALPGAAVPPPSPGSQPSSNNVAALQQPEGSTVVVTGKLVNLGANYFDPRSRRIVLVDPSGTQIDVVGGLPLEIIPRSNVGGPQTLSNVLNKQVEISGIVQQGSIAPGERGVKATAIRVLQ